MPSRTAHKRIVPNILDSALIKINPPAPVLPCSSRIPDPANTVDTTAEGTTLENPLARDMADVSEPPDSHRYTMPGVLERADIVLD